jgi:hypothetical protein
MIEVMEQDHRPVAVIRSPQVKGRLLSWCIALAESRGAATILDEGFMNDVEEGIARCQQPPEKGRSLHSAKANILAADCAAHPCPDASGLAA